MLSSPITLVTRETDNSLCGQKMQTWHEPSGSVKMEVSLTVEIKCKRVCKPVAIFSNFYKARSSL